MNGTNCNTDERGLLPYPVILAATKGDSLEAMNIVMQHYQSEHSPPVYPKNPRRARQHLLRYRRGLTGTAASKAHAGCPIL